MAEVHGSCDDRFAGGAGGAGAAASTATSSAPRSPSTSTGRPSSTSGAATATPTRTTPWTRGHDRQRLVDDEDACCSLAALMLVERGELDVDAPVGDYWPEFSAKGKKDVLVRHLMSHTSGVSGWEQPFSVRGHVRLGDRDRAAGAAAAVVGAGDGVGLPRGQPGPPGRRADPADHQQDVQDSSSPTRSPGRSARTSRSARGSRTSTASRPLVAPPPRPSRPATPDPASIAVRTFTGPVAVGEGDDDPGVAGGRPGRAERPLQRPRRAATCCAACRSAARPAGCGCSRRRRSTWCSTQQADGVDLVLGARSGSGSATASARRVVPYVPDGAHLLLGRLGRLDGRDGPRPAADDHVHDEPDGARHPRLGPRSEAYVRAVYAALG